MNAQAAGRAGPVPATEEMIEKLPKLEVTEELLSKPSTFSPFSHFISHIETDSVSPLTRPRFDQRLYNLSR